MKKIALSAAFLLLVVFLVPLLMPKNPAARQEKPSLDEVLQNAPLPEASAGPSGGISLPGAEDSSLRVRLLSEGEVLTLPLEEYIFGVVASEMPASFEPEALKAQAVAARTYTLYRLKNGGAHDEADVCSDSSCCKAWSNTGALEENWGSDAAVYGEKIWQAVSSTADMAVLYGGEPIDAVFHSSSADFTQSALQVWGRDVDYLQSVETGGEEASSRFLAEKTFAADDFKAIFLSHFPKADFSGSMESWVSDIALNESGAVAGCKIGGVEVAGTKVREIFSLQSTRFEYSVKDGTAVFSTRGYGHGVGMSQYGANAMALDGADYDEILRHYYTGTEVKKIDPGTVVPG